MSNSNPTDDYSQCHIGIIKNFQSLKELGELSISEPVSPQIQAQAGQLVRFFKDVVMTHHREEEQELFTVVLDCASPGEELAQAQALVERLTREHRALEKEWKALEGAIKKLAKGKLVALDRNAAVRMAEHYLAHAEFEEAEFLPLSATILKDTGMAELGLTLHSRHQQSRIPGYI